MINWVPPFSPAITPRQSTAGKSPVFRLIGNTWFFYRLVPLFLSQLIAKPAIASRSNLCYVDPILKLTGLKR